MFGLKSSSLTLIVLSTLTAAAPQPIARRAASDLSITAQLALVDLVADRYTLLPDNSDFVYNFTNNNPFANRKTFPALVGSGISLVAADFPGCAFSTMHVHPRAAEILYIASGRAINYMIPEGGVLDANGTARVIETELGPSSMTIQPQGAFHTTYNPDCTPASGIAAFNSEDEGFTGIPDLFFAMPDDVIGSQLGEGLSGPQIDGVRAAIAKRVNLAQECQKRCNMTTSSS